MEFKSKFVLLGSMTAIAVVLSFFGCRAKDNKIKDSNDTQIKKEEKIMKPIEITKSEFLKRVVDFEKSSEEWKYLGDKPCIVDFYATWCGPCKSISPILEELAAEYADKIYIYKVDTDKEQELAAAFGIRSIPTLLFVPLNGQPQISQGAMSKNMFKETIENVLLNNK